MHIPEEKISEILNVADIVDVISESVILKKSGLNFFGLCPFHSEKTPSFSVNANKQIFHCFGCSAGGNVLSYVMKYHGITFPEAVKMLARKYHVTIEPQSLGPAGKAAFDMKESLFRLNRKMMAAYEQILDASSTKTPAMTYLRDRGISEEIIREFHIGFAPDAWDTAVRVLKARRVSKKTALQSGLVMERKNTSGFYDRFRNRIMFPIFDINMQVAGFGGRVMDDSHPKYMNSPETPVYNKSRILYGLHAAKPFCRKEGRVFIVEGYFDFLSLYQHGLKNTVATLGTALTSDHVRILKGYAPQMVLVFDSDAAGISAAKRSIKTFINEGVDTRILVLPGDNDPDSYVMANGADAFVQQAESATRVMQFLLQVSIDTHGLSVEGRLRVLDEMKPHLAEIQDMAMRSLYVKELAETLNIDEKAVLEKVRDQVFRVPSEKRFPADDSDMEPGLASDRREEQIITMMLGYPDMIADIKKTDALSYFYSDRLRRIAEKIISVDAPKGAFVSAVMASMKTQEDQQLIASFAMHDFSGDPEEIHAAALSIIQRMIRVRLKQDNTLTGKIISAEKGCDAELMELLKQKQAQIRQLHDC